MKVMLDMVCLGVYSAHACPLSQQVGQIRLWGKFDLDSILDKGDQILRFIGRFKYLAMEDLLQGLVKENCSINVEYLDNKRDEITAGAYLLSIT